jgi:hypothetical protein
LHIPRRDKLDFFKLTGKFENFRIANQKVVLSDSSLLIECDQSTNVEKAKEHIDAFFEKKEYQYIETKILKEIVLDKDQIKLIFQNNSHINISV